MTMPKFEPVAHMQVSVEEGVDTYFPRLHKPEKYNKDWWRFDPLHSADQLTEAYEAGKRDAIPEDILKDAERYRWLRECGSNWVKCDVDTEISMSQPDNWDWPTTIDAVIDAAIAAAPKGGE